RCIPHGVEQGSQAVRLDRDGRIHHGETLPLPADVGEDPARLHQSPGPETKEIGVHLFHGHYTRLVPSGGDCSTPSGTRVAEIRPHARNTGRAAMFGGAAITLRSEPRPVRPSSGPVRSESMPSHKAPGGLVAARRSWSGCTTPASLCSPTPGDGPR